MPTRTRIALGALATIVRRVSPRLRLLLPAALLVAGLGPALPAPPQHHKSGRRGPSRCLEGAMTR
jgi:hypothetical protein